MLTNLAELVNHLQLIAPEYVGLLSAKDEEEFDDALIPLIRRAVDHLESNRKNYLELGETGLTAVFAASMSGFGLSVTQETNSNGHVDVTVVGFLCSPVQKRLGEAKLYSGYQYHVDGIGQLLGYMSGRDSGYVLNFVRKQNINGLVKGLRLDMDKNKPHRQSGTCSDHSLSWSFCSLHDHKSGERVRVTHVGFNMFP